MQNKTTRWLARGQTNKSPWSWRSPSLNGMTLLCLKLPNHKQKMCGLVHQLHASCFVLWRSVACRRLRRFRIFGVGYRAIDRAAVYGMAWGLGNSLPRICPMPCPCPRGFVYQAVGGGGGDAVRACSGWTRCVGNTNRASSCTSLLQN